ncbi:hypothetical protein IKN40_08860 [bacterium]|nr:hypothetical protein [Clostridia bacterium]MBR6908529.1 hypothetical protein [bacterium]
MCKVLIDNEEFKSLKDAASFLEISNFKMSKLLDTKEPIMLNGFKVQRIGRIKQHKKLICLETKEVFNTIKDLSKKLKVDNYVISDSLNHHNVFKHAGKSYYRLSDKSTLTRTVTEPVKKGPRHVTVMCKQTGEIFESIKDLADRLGVHFTGISKALLKDKIYRRNGLSYVKYEFGKDDSGKIEGLEKEQQVQHVMDIVVQNTDQPTTKESAEQVIRRLTCENINAGDYYVARILLEVLEKLTTKTEKIVNNS